MSTHLIARRRLKELAARTLPEALKRRMRGLLYGYRRSRVSLPVAFLSDPSGPVVVIADRIRLRFAEQDRPAIRTHVADHGAAVKEMSSFIDIAASAGTFFDVGADRAIFSLVFCGLGGGRRAVAYEPSPGRFGAAVRLAGSTGSTAGCCCGRRPSGRFMAGRAGRYSPTGRWCPARSIRWGQPPTSR
jgi:hypothetical protein